MLNEVKDFILHLRLPYQLFILSGPFLLGGFLSPQFDTNSFVIQFFNVHILLFGGVTAYNSYFDKDEGPIGGLANPPKMKVWMLYVSWVLQILGLLIAYTYGEMLAIIYLINIFLYWLYSSPTTRWKSQPILSVVTMCLTLFFSTFLGFFAFGGEGITLNLLLGATGGSILIISMYPMSQIYQVEEDTRRGDKTFAVRYGLKGVINIFKLLYPLGIVLVALSVWSINQTVSYVFLIAGLIVGFIVYKKIKWLTTSAKEYKKIMRIKYGGGLAFSIIFLFFILFL